LWGAKGEHGLLTTIPLGCCGGRVEVDVAEWQTGAVQEVLPAQPDRHVRLRSRRAGRHAFGLYRTYTGANLAAALVGLGLGDHAADSGLHLLAVVISVISLLLLVAAVIRLRGKEG
jgi:hypothetical protein